MDKALFGSFVAELRKEKDWTQKELAEKLFVSDKAVSKWERGLSLPDIQLLIPLAEIMGVTVTELLEGRRMENPEPMEPEQVEQLVKKAINLSEPAPVNPKRIMIFLGAVLILVLEKAVGSLVGTAFQPTSLTLELLAVFFGVYFWFFIKERLPDYYDQNRIGAYYDGPFRMNVPGVSFNNTNWPRIVRFLRIWSVTVMVVEPLIGIGISFLPGWLSFGAQMVLLAVFLLSLFVPMYILGRTPAEEKPKADKNRLAITAIALVGVVGLLAVNGPGSSRSAFRIGFSESGGWNSWSASYVSLDGTMSKPLRLEEEPAEYLLTVETKGGSLDITISGEEGILFFESDVPSGSYPVTLSGSVRVSVEAANHRGSFSILPLTE